MTQAALSTQASITPLPTVTSFIAPLALLPTYNGQSLFAGISTDQHHSTAISVFRMDFVQEFLALKPEVLFKVSEAEVSFKTANHTPPTTFLIMLVAIFFIVLVMMIIFMVGVCHLCRTTPSISESDESVTLVEQPV